MNASIHVYHFVDHGGRLGFGNAKRAILWPSEEENEIRDIEEEDEEDEDIRRREGSWRGRMEGLLGCG